MKHASIVIQEDSRTHHLALSEYACSVKLVTMLTARADAIPALTCVIRAPQSLVVALTAQTLSIHCIKTRLKPALFAQIRSAVQLVSLAV